MSGIDIQAAIQDGIGNQRAAADPGISAWVSASAGAGKTHVLANRVLRLLLAGARPEGILCLTYTKIAAGEMANRIFQRLAEWAAAPDDRLIAALTALAGTAPDAATMDRARRLFAQVLDLPGGLRIQTIHAFCQSLLARFPIEAGIAPNSRIVDERTAAEILAEARDRALLDSLAVGEGAPGAGAIGLLAARGGEIAIRAAISELFARRARLRRLREPGFEADGVPLDLLDRLVPRAPAARPDEAALRHAAAVLAGGGRTDRDRGAIIESWLALPDPDRAEGLEDYARAFLTATERAVFKTLATRAVAARDPVVVPALAREAKRVQAVLKRRHGEKTAAISGALIRLGHAMHGSYQARKSLQGALDYDDLITYSNGLLQGTAVDWVHYKLDGGVDHILIDEAQDTSPDQWGIVEGLAADFFAGAGARADLDPAPARTIFAVGDVKQSIFSFQGAEPHAFLDREGAFKARVQGAAREWKDVTLRLSFRAAPEILHLVDRVFADPVAADGVSFDGAPIAHAAKRHDQVGRVELWPLEPRDGKVEAAPWDFPRPLGGGQSPALRLARRIASTIKGWIDGGEPLPSRGRAVREGDVMILVRRRNPFFHAMVRALKAMGVGVAGSDRMVLTDEIAVRDLMAAGAFALLPEDDLNLAALLKSPLIGFDEETLFALAAARSRSILWRELEARRGEREEFAKAHARLGAWLARADYVPPFEFYAGLLNAGGGRERLVARLGPEVNDPIDEFLSLALAHERLHPPGLQGFLAWIERGSAEIKRDQGAARDEVRVMTVHGAKGLESPIVFLPDTTGLPGERPSLLWLGTGGERGALPLWPAQGDPMADAVAAAKDAAREAELREYRRLLYVALTRAEDRLYVCGWEGGKPGAAPSWYEMIEKAMADWPEVREVSASGQTVRRVEREPGASGPETPGEGRDPPITPIQVPVALAGPPPPEPQAAMPLAPSQADDGVEPPRLRAGRGPGAGQRGRLIHRLLQWLPGLASGEREAVALGYLSRPLFGLGPEDRKALFAAVDAVLSTAGFQALFGPGSRAEVPIIGRAGARGQFVVSGQVDRLVVLDDRVLIVDYKSSRKPPRGLDKVPPAHLRQMAAYRAVLARAFPGRVVHAALLWTEGPKLMALPPDLLDRHAP